MPTTYSHRLTLLIASVAGCSGATDAGRPSVRDLPGGGVLDQCLAPPSDLSIHPYDENVVIANCVDYVAEGDECLAADRPVADWTYLPSGGCGAPGRTLCVTAAAGRADARDTGGFDSGSDTDPLPPYDRCLYKCVIVLDGSVCGRPLVDGHGAFALAPTIHRDDWCDPAELRDMPENLRAALAQRWLTDAAAEHASIASFAQLALDLLAHGAPATLITRVTAAMQDEVRHARTAYGIASALLGRTVGPGPLPVARLTTPSLARLATDTVRDGCVNESLAAAEAAARLAGTRIPALRRALARVVADEARHAALARDVVDWAVSVGGADVAQAVAAAWRSAVHAPVLDVDEVHAPDVGLCGGVALADVRRRVRDEVWAPETHL